MATCKALIVPVDGPVRLEDVNYDGPGVIHAILGGWLEAVRAPGNCHAYVDEEGLLKRLPYNPGASAILDKNIVGPAIFFGNHDPEEGDVTEDLLDVARAYGVL